MQAPHCVVGLLCLALAAGTGSAAQTKKKTDAPPPLPPPAETPKTDAKPKMAEPSLPPLPGAPAPKTAAPPAGADAKKTVQLGIYKLQHPGQPRDPAFEEIEQVLRGIAEGAPNVKNALFMQNPPKACDLEDDSCFALLGAFQQLDQILVGMLVKAENGIAIRVRLIDVPANKRISQAEQIVATSDKTELKAWSESLACRLLIPAGCTGEALVDLDLPQMQLIVDNKPMARSGKNPEKLTLPVGVHKIRVTVGQRTSLERPLPVMRTQRSSAPSLYARQFEKGGLSLLASKDLPLGKDGKPSVAKSQEFKEGGTRWTKPTGIALMAAGAIAGGLGGWQGLRSKSLVNDANAAYDANQGAYFERDVATIDSARSAASTANILLITGVVLAAAGATLTFAF